MKKKGTFDEAIAALYNASVAVRLYDTPNGRMSKEAYQIVRRLRAAIRVLREAEKAMIHMPDGLCAFQYFYELDPPNRALARAILAARKVAENNIESG